MLAILLLVPPLAFAGADVTFEWDGNTEADLAGYRIYQSAQSDTYIYGTDSPNKVVDISRGPNPGGTVISLSGATIYCTMKKVEGSIKIDRQTDGINISDAAAGEFEYKWQSGDTDTLGSYHIEFEINPSSCGKFTIPADPNDIALVKIEASLDTT